MPRRPEIGNIQLYPNRPLTDEDKNGYTLKFWIPFDGCLCDRTWKVGRFMRCVLSVRELFVLKKGGVFPQNPAATRTG